MDLISAIKQDIWIPFMEAYRDYDEEKLKSIHTEDILRINIDNNQIRYGAPYLNEFAAFLPRMKQNGDKVGIAFVILTTAFNNTKEIAYQTGYYQFQMQSMEEEAISPRGYGYFHVGLRKEKDVWKIFLDSDKKADLNTAQFKGGNTVYELEN
ncbi:hypothetical protein [Croceivirga thetidis]|uniref:Nuclear transport factor 2 family protein n=1 Tax=Croceivirga thetidis TaxID=2721623 RepID=A0ABX1GR32_9FLAO|nr:hypothetical protein [Croceivirga thetidis]NKI32407.1 hypothetical protein [Croceivirga thetidis]